MKFRFGPMPQDPLFEPEQEGWIPVREPSPTKTMLIMIPPMVVVGLLFSLLYWLAGADVSWLLNIRNWPIALVIMAGTAPVHELLHLLCLPGLGLNDKAIVGFWLKMFAPYVYYDGVLSRNRYILVCAGPFVVLSAIPLLLSFIKPDIPVLILAISYLNCLMCAGDFAGILVLLTLAEQ
jgi:hypothetical protein